MVFWQEIALSLAERMLIVYHTDIQYYKEELLSDPYLRLLQLMQLADSALPIGSTAHSFGLETLVMEGLLTVEHLEEFLRAYFEEAGRFESAACHLAYRLASLSEQETFTGSWVDLQQQLSAFKTARESRAASMTLGRRFLQLVQQFFEMPALSQVFDISKSEGTGIHYSAAFGLVGGILEVDEMLVVLAYLQQSLTGLISACQRLMPLGQSRASGMLWRLKPVLLEVAGQGKNVGLNSNDLALFTPLLDMGSMGHPYLTTRLFVS